jgi:hypothetical protein
LAQAKYRGKHPQLGFESDNSKALDIALKISRGSVPEAEYYLKWLFERTRNMLNMGAVWIPVCAVAEQLAKVGKLSGKEVRRLRIESLSGPIPGLSAKEAKERF